MSGTFLGVKMGTGSDRPLTSTGSSARKASCGSLSALSAVARSHRMPIDLDATVLILRATVQVLFLLATLSVVQLLVVVVV